MIIELIDAREYGPNNIMAHLRVVDDEGNITHMAHFMPKDAAEWRVAEYGLDPDDHDTLVDVLLFEPYTHDDVAEEDRLHAAPTVEHAREALLGAVRARKATSEAKRQAARGKAADNEPEVRQRMAGLFVIDPDVVEAKREHVGRMREAVQAEAARPAPDLAVERASFLRPVATRSQDVHPH